LARNAAGQLFTKATGSDTTTGWREFARLLNAKPAYVQTYSTADRTFSAYTSDPENAAYTGAADGEAKLADLNSLRVAYENLRVFTEDLAALVNAMVDDMQSAGWAT
jgi:hypothetical protein